MSKSQAKRLLGPGETPRVRYKYTHMLQEDQVVWTAFIESGVLELEQVWYDVHVGRPMAVLEDAPAYMKYVVDGVSRKRIDVVGRTGNQTFVIEVKPIANMTAIGQAVTYVNLFIGEFEVHGPVQAMIVATWVDHDVLDIARRQNVKIVALEGEAP